MTDSGKEVEVARRGALERGWNKHKLMRELAIGEKKNYQLAKAYGVSTPAISEFKRRHKGEIEEVKEKMADEYVGLWVASKLSRLAVYQEAAEKMAKGYTPRDAEVLVGILKAVAEELGDLPARTQVQVNTGDVTYAVIGIDPDDLT